MPLVLAKLKLSTISLFTLHDIVLSSTNAENIKRDHRKKQKSMKLNLAFEAIEEFELAKCRKPDSQGHSVDEQAMLFCLPNILHSCPYRHLRLITNNQKKLSLTKNVEDYFYTVNHDGTSADYFQISMKFI